MISVTNKATGELIEIDTSTPEQLVKGWQLAQEYSKTAEKLKDELKALVPILLNDKGVSDEIGNFVFKQNDVQRMTYNKAVMRDVLDPDVFDVLLEPNKTAVDEYLKENLESLGDVSTTLRASMKPKGKPYQVIKLEKVSE
jgi:hypothetical protein